MWEPTENTAGKLFDSHWRFTLLIKIRRGDIRGQILERLASGTSVGFKTLTEAISAQEEFMKLAKATEPLGKFASYGLTAVIDDRDGTVNCVNHIG